MRKFQGISYPEDEYLGALGIALFHFTLLEQGVVSYIEEKDPGFLATSYDLTSGVIMNRFEEVSVNDEKLLKMSSELIKIAKLRNMLFHARPAANNGELPRLSYAGREGFKTWEIDEISVFSEKCVEMYAFFTKHAADNLDAGLLGFDVGKFLQRASKLIQRWKAKRPK